MEFYGTHWDGPVPTEDDTDRVVVNDLPPLLSTSQQQALTGQLPPNNDPLSED